MSTWRGKTGLVTGASGGIGRAIAKRLAESGVNVVACARNEAKLAALRDEVGSDGTLVPVAADLRREEDIERLFRVTRERFGGVDILVNNAGLGHDAPLLSGSSQHWREMLELNVLALCICTREALQDMRQRGDAGQVIHISSMAGYRVAQGSGVYSATKHAVRALTEALRQELREADSGIRISAISPGFVETGFAAQYHRDPKAAERTYGQFKVIQADEIADAVIYILSQPPHLQIHDMLMRPTRQRS